jgi:ABC-2 type transport system permease protein
MRKSLVVAIREYAAAVKTKSFIISVILLPIMMFGGIFAQKLAEKIGDTSTRRVAIIDRTPDASIYDIIARAVEKHNQTAVLDTSGRQVRAKFAVEKVAPADLSDRAAVDRQRLEISKRVRKGELLAFVEIGPDLLKPASAPSTQPFDDDRAGDRDRAAIQYSTNRPTYMEFRSLLERELSNRVLEKRFKNAGMDFKKFEPLLARPTVTNRGLADEVGGRVTFEQRPAQFASFLVPLVLLLLMFVVVLVGASPMAGNVIEEKQLRIAEVLLGSVRPFELMLGKLLGGAGVAMTLALIYFGGAYAVAMKAGVAHYVSPLSIVWFISFTVVATLMYGSMFVAAGAAVTNLKEVQTIIMPVMLLIVLPMMLLGPMIQDPSGPVATAASFFPTSAPMVMVARLSIPPGVPVWQAIVAALITLVTTAGLVWAAGRIFRVGILLHGQGAKFGDLLRWVVRG